MIPDPHPAPAPAPEGAATGGSSVDLMEIRSWCATVLAWTTVPEWRRMTEATHQMREAYWALAREIDPERVRPDMADDYEVVLSKGRELVGGLDAAVSGEPSKALHHLRQTAMKVKGLCAVFGVQRPGAPALGTPRAG